MKNNSPTEWKNEDNNLFYEEVSFDGLQKLAIKAGILEGCDVLSVKKYWEESQYILDACSGFGRVPKALNKNGFSGEILAVERCSEQFLELNKSCSEYTTTVHGDIYFLKNVKAKFDAIFLMWSGLADFPPYQQSEIIGLLSEVLSDNGKIIIDTMPMNVQPLDTEEFTQRSFLTRAENSVVRTYEPTDEEIQKYAEACHLSVIDVVHCKTDTDRLRWLYVLA